MQGKIIRGIGGFYYVHIDSIGIVECKAKGIFRNKKVKPLVGDNVEVEILDKEKLLGSIYSNQIQNTPMTAMAMATMLR